jgi:hypothetical protein
MSALNQQHENACVMVVPRDARGNEHVTVSYVFQPGSVKGTQIERYVRSVARWCLPFFSRVTEHDVFGHAYEEVRVARLDVSPFYVVRHMCEWLDKGSWIYKPHITEVAGILRPVGEFIYFDRIGLWFNDEVTNWRLGTGEPSS